jgi:MFS transporter, DHA2 family, multidrug resistance protein
MAISEIAAQSAGADESEKRHRALITGCAMIATLMQALDNTIANVALPHMQGSLSASRDQITWVLTSYVIAAAIMTTPVGWFTNRFGRKHFFIVCLAGFTVASMLCGLAQSLTQIVLFRLLQGSFGAALVPLSQSIMLDIYPAEKRGSAMAIWGMGVMVGPILGPTLGGYLTDLYNWRWVFYVNVPFGIAAIAGLWFFLHEHKKDATLRFDWTGFTVLAIGLGGLQLMLDRGTTKGWFSSSEIVIEAILAGIGLYLFTVHMLTEKKPFIPPRIFRDVGFVSGFAIMFVMGVVILASSALLPPYLQNLAGYSVQQAGLLMTPRGFGTMFSMLIAARLSQRFDPRLVSAAGVLMMAWSMWEMSHWTPDIGIWELSIIGIVQGIGMGFVFVAIQLVGFATLEPRLRTDGTALYALVRSIGMAIGVSVSSLLLTDSLQIVHAQLAAHVTPFNRALQYGPQSLFWGIATPFGLTNMDMEIQRQAAIIGYANDFKLMFWICLPMLALLPLMRRPAAVAKDSPEPALE